MKTEFPVTDTISLAFPTPIYRHLWPDSAAVNEGLRRIVLERERTEPGLARSNVGGWHSREDLFDWVHPEIATLRGWVATAIRDMTQFALEGALKGQLDIEIDGGAWVNLCRDGGYNKIHNHPDCSWSGVYYVCLGEADPDAPPEAGQIEFLDPRMGALMVTAAGPDAPPKFTIVPEPGLMLIFPNWLYHYVNPFRGKGERISIAFNIRLRFGEKTGP
jgi:uncharacterized protein (TIGR02466 family)